MKYWKQLNELDEAVYKVKAVNSGLQILGRTDEMTSANSELPEEFQTFLADLNDRMDEAVQNLNDKFQNVWDAVRDSAFDESIAAIDELEEEQNASKRFDQILENLPTMNSTASDLDFNFDLDLVTMNDSDLFVSKQKDLFVSGSLDDSGVSIGNLDEYFSIDFTHDPKDSGTGYGYGSYKIEPLDPSKPIKPLDLSSVPPYSSYSYCSKK